MPARPARRNYNLLRNTVFAALGGDAAAKTAVTSWVTQSRTGLDPFLNLADVRVVIYAIGTAWTQDGVTTSPWLGRNAPEIR
jgi:hypothetical protein